MKGRTDRSEDRPLRNGRLRRGEGEVKGIEGKDAALKGRRYRQQRKKQVTRCTSLEARDRRVDRYAREAAGTEMLSLRYALRRWRLECWAVL